VAGFIGSPAMNFLAGKVGANGRSIDLVGVGDTRVSVQLLSTASVPSGTPVTLGLRPEHFVPTDHGALELEIDLAEPLGADTLLHGRFGHARELATVRLPGHVLAKPGEKRRYAVSPERLHLFDAQTGKRLAGI
jgi:sn-glycerol 3-phosphate transport system ATP-binding protein